MSNETMLIDGESYPIQQGDKVLDIARREGIDIPTLCFNPLFKGERSGACRLCVVEVLDGGRKGLESSCTLPAVPGLSVSTHSERVFQERRTVVELLLSEHVQDCRNCPKSGDCFFAKMCREYDIDGVPVCAECPNQKEGCLLSRGVLCLGPITYANCNAYCTRRGYRCEGCHSTIVNKDLLRYGLSAMKDAGFSGKEILQEAQLFSKRGRDALEEVLMEMGMLEGGV